MTPERYSVVKRILGSALESEPGQRTAFLAQACGDDEELRAEVLSLLAHREPSADFMEESAFEVSAWVLADEAVKVMPGRRVGPYRIVREVGCGGMGVVYEAERDDEQYRKRVAVKFIKREMGTGGALRRFHNERQILANLEHPNIARLIDGGATEEGLPYLVMEYVAGEPINQFCDSRRLTVEERLQLFRTVCAAVHFAHQNLVIHRDLKPGNILVTPDGVPKLLDFGIARLAQADGRPQEEGQTATPLCMLTPAYASPEQIRGERITTASDIYSLGVLLYELLTGLHPYHVGERAPYELARAVCEESPERPSRAVGRAEAPAGVAGGAAQTAAAESVSRMRADTPGRLRRRLAGDLDNIVLMALRKEPGRRYSSAEQLSEDLRRYAAGLPVRAHKDTFAYRGAKFVARNRLGVGLAAFAFVALLAGLAAVGWQAHVARVQRGRAERRFQDVRQLANSFVFEFHDGIKDLPGSTSVREQLVKKGLIYLDGLAQEADDDRSLQLELAQAYVKIGDIQGLPYQPNLGDTEGALVSYHKSEVILLRLLAAAPGHAEAQLSLARTYAQIGTVLDAKGEVAEALAIRRRAAGMLDALARANPNNVVYQLEVANVLTEPLFFSAEAGRSVELGRECLEWVGRDIAVVERLSSAHPADAALRAQLAYRLYNSGYLLWLMGDLTGDRQWYRQAFESTRRGRDMLEEFSSAEPANATHRRDAADASLSVGQSLFKWGAPAEALGVYRKSLQSFEELAKADSSNREILVDLTVAHQYMAEALGEAGSLKEALGHASKSREIILNLSGSNPKRYRRVFVSACELNGDLLARAHDTPAAVAGYREALSLLDSWSADEPSNANVRRLTALVCVKIGRAYTDAASGRNTAPGARQEALREARQWYAQGLGIWRGLRERVQLTAADARIFNEASNAAASLVR